MPAGWTQLRSIVGLPMEQFHHFCAAFDQTGSYVMAGERLACKSA
jgi:hypothetical protein